MKYMHSLDLVSCVENAQSPKFLKMSLNIFFTVKLEKDVSLNLGRF